MRIFLSRLAFAAGVWALANGAYAANTTGKDTQEKAKQTWQMLDYLAVDYAKAVQGGKVASTSEYLEMQEFAHGAERQLGELPLSAATPSLLKGAAALRQAIDSKASSSAVGEQARQLAAGLLTAYPVPVAPSKAPDLRQGATIYQSQCAACHGATGHADGPLAATLTPPPIALADHDRARQRSVFSLQQIISHGVAGTAMPAFTQLTDDERWAVAYYASTLSYSAAEREQGAALWAASPTLHAAVPNLSALSQASEEALSQTAGATSARTVLAYLRNTPQTVATSSTDTLPIARTRLKESIAALERGDEPAASRLALSAYLDGFEPVEPALAAKNDALFQEIEKMMGLYRGAVTSRNLEHARSIEQGLQSRLGQAQDALGGSNDPLSTFLGALTILLREGVEALLVVVAMMAFLKKADRADVLPYVHAGWVAALAGGGVTWAVATYLVDISGASREMTEGFSAIFAALVLLAVGIWMHQKSLAGRWQAYVKDKLSAALNKPSAATMLFLLSFVTVYREVFETVLFYAALWTGDNGVYLLAGLGSGMAILALLAILLLRSSARLPISQFFAASSALVAILAVVLIGKGAAALQKVGILKVTPLSLPRVDALGFYPSVQTVVAQMIILLIIAISVFYNVRCQQRRRAANV
jgi:high-affinity iron transporter